MTFSRSRRPEEVTAPISPRAVAGTAETITSCLLRLASASCGNGSPFDERASRPVEDSSTRHGSSAIWSGTAGNAAVLPDVRRADDPSAPHFFVGAVISAGITLLRA